MNKLFEKELIDLVLQFGILKRTVRTGWKKKGIKDPESVAEHSYRVTILAMLLSDRLGLDQTKLIKMSLVHDLGEARIGDLIWEEGEKVIGSQKDKHTDESHAINEIFRNGFTEYINLWEEYGEQKSEEAKIIKQLDKLEMIFQAIEYEKEGYSPVLLNEFWENAEKYLKGKELEPILIALKNTRKELNK